MILARIRDSNGNMGWYPFFEVVEYEQGVTINKSWFQKQENWRRKPNPDLPVAAVGVS